MTSTKTEVLLRAAQKWRAFNNTEEDKRSRARWGCTDLSNANSAVWEACLECISAPTKWTSWWAAETQVSCYATFWAKRSI